MSDAKKKVGECTVSCKNDVLHLVVLVAGTTDPINNEPVNKRALSYTNAPKGSEQYWDTVKSLEDYKPYYKTDEAFYESFQKLTESRKAGFFPFHGWSGDNKKGNRETAGAYLVNRLVGANNEKPFYGKSYQAKEIHIHLIGHSHGGNVMNEMTKQMDKLGGKWPATWKVRSFTYLSTPFFKTLHQVKLGSFVHPKAEVLNVYNDYDMTQRMLADFSLFTLHDAINVNQIEETIKTSMAQFMASYNAVPWDLLTDLYLNEQEGRKLYTATRDLLGSPIRRDGFLSAIQFLQDIEAIFVGLNKPTAYNVDSELRANNKISHSFKLVSDANLANLQRVIAALTASINQSVGALNEGIISNSYSRKDFAARFLRGGLSLANNLAAFLNVSAGVANVGTSGVLWQTAVSLLSDAIEVFDDTVAKPEAQFGGSRTITHLNVTTRDHYDKSAQKANYLKLIARIEALEKNYAAAPSQNLLLDLLLMLLVHNPQMRGIAMMARAWANRIDTFEYVAWGDVDTTAKSVHATLTNFADALLNRFVGEIEDTADTAPNLKTGKRGSLPYLFTESHSVSRRVLHPEVKAFLQRMMG